VGTSQQTGGQFCCVEDRVVGCGLFCSVVVIQGVFMHYNLFSLFHIGSSFPCCTVGLGAYLWTENIKKITFAIVPMD
jgi:hypothetical protein